MSTQVMNKRLTLITKVEAYEKASVAVYGKNLNELHINEFKKLLSTVAMVFYTIEHFESSEDQELVTITREFRENYIPLGESIKIDDLKPFLEPKKIKLQDGREVYTVKGRAASYVVTDLGKYILSFRNQLINIGINSQQIDFDSFARDILKMYKKGKLPIEFTKEFLLQTLEVIYERCQDLVKVCRARYGKEMKPRVFTSSDEYEEYILHTAMKFQPVEVEEENYKEALRLALTNHNTFVVSIVERIFKYQNIATFKDLQKGGRETNEWALLPREVRRALFPMHVEIDIVAAMPAVLYNLCEVGRHLKNLRIEYIRQKSEKYLNYMKEFSGFRSLITNPKDTRYSVGLCFDISSFKSDCFPDDVKRAFTLSRDFATKLGKKITTQLIGGKRFKSVKSFSKDIKALLREQYRSVIGKDISEQVFKKYLAKVKKALNAHDVIKNIKNDLARFRKMYQVVNVPLFYQRIESSIMRPLYQKFIREVTPNAILIYDGIDILDGTKIQIDLKLLETDFNRMFADLIVELNFKYLNNFLNLTKYGTPIIRAILKTATISQKIEIARAVIYENLICDNLKLALDEKSKLKYLGLEAIRFDLKMSKEVERALVVNTLL